MFFTDRLITNLTRFYFFYTCIHFLNRNLYKENFFFVVFGHNYYVWKKNFLNNERNFTTCNFPQKILTLNKFVILTVFYTYSLYNTLSHHSFKVTLKKCMQLNFQNVDFL